MTKMPLLGRWLTLAARALENAAALNGICTLRPEPDLGLTV